MQICERNDISNTKIISFVIPVKNDAKRLQSCLESIALQNVSGINKEIIVLDNGSIDNSLEVASGMGAIVKSAPELSVAQLRNMGAFSSKGEFIAFVDADHVLSANWLADGLDAINEPGCGIAGALCISPSSTWVQRAYDRFRRRPDVKMEVEWLGSGNMLIQKGLFLKLNGFDESLETCEDVDLCQRARKNGWRIIADPNIVSVHFGDPATLKSLFLGELWRGRNNLRVTMKGPITLRAILSLIVSALSLPGFVLTLVGIFMQLCGITSGLWILLLGATLVAAPAVLRCFFMSCGNMRVLFAFENFIFTVTYNLARSLALVTSVSHNTRRDK